MKGIRNLLKKGMLYLMVFLMVFSIVETFQKPMEVYAATSINLTHVCTGNSSSGGGCYKSPIYHGNHTGGCYHNVPNTCGGGSSVFHPADGNCPSGGWYNGAPCNCGHCRGWSSCSSCGCFAHSGSHSCGGSHPELCCGLSYYSVVGWNKSCGLNTGNTIGSTNITSGWSSSNYYINGTTSWTKAGSIIRIDAILNGVTHTGNANKVEIFANGTYTIKVYYKDYYDGENLTATGTYTVTDYGTVITYNPNNRDVTLNNIFGDKITTDATGTMNKTVVIPDKDVKLAENSYSRKGYTFLGWSFNPNITLSEFTNQTDIIEQYKDLNAVANQTNRNTTDGKSITQNSTGTLKGTIGEKTDSTGAWRGTHAVTLYAIWMPNGYNIYYDKGLTDDTTHQSIADATRNTNIQSTGTSRPYTHCIYDSNIKIATISPVLGRSYKLQFNSNKPASVSKQLTNNGDVPTTLADTTGYLPSKNTWKITGQDSDVTTNLEPTMGSTLTKTNYKDANNTSVTATAQWNNITLKNFTSPTLTGWSFIGWYDNQQGNNSTAVTGNDVNTINNSVNTSKNINVTTKGNITEWLINPTTTKFDRTLYARWQRTITLTFNMNGGQYLGRTEPIVMTGIYYNNSDGYNFKLDDTLNQKYLPDYETQISNYKLNGTQKGIDAYGTFNSNGENSKYTLIKDDGTRYRFLGWSTNPSATEPDTNLSVYSSSHKLEYRIYDDITLYAIWEPVLTANINVYRTLGSLTFSDGSTPKTSVSGIKSSDGLQQLQVIAKSGEQCGYTIALTGNNDVKVGIQFDTKITDIYNHQGAWTDNLNPSTEEDLVSNQNHGLDRNIQLSNKTATRKFFIPQYLGTDKSYITSQGIKVYTADILLQQDSYYYRGLDKKEEVPVHITIYLTTDPTGNPIKPTPTPDDPSPVDPDTVISVLDELRTRLKIRLH